MLEIYTLHLHKHDTIQRETKTSLAFAVPNYALFQLSNITRMSARVTKCYLLLCMSFSPPPLTSKLVSFHIILNCVILYTATSATICKFVYFCNALICHLYDFKRIKVCLSVCKGDNLYMTTNLPFLQHF